MNSDLDELRSGLREALASIAPIDHTSERMELPESWDVDGWQQLSSQLALPGLGLPEKYGGQGFGPVEQGIALEETGRVLYPGPYLAGPVIAGSAILLSGDEAACADLLPAIAAGTAVATLALTDEGGPTRAVRDGADTLLLTGTKAGVIAGADADVVVVVADCDGEPVLAVVERGAEGFASEHVPVLDLTRRMARLGFDGTRARLLHSAHPRRPIDRRRPELGRLCAVLRTGRSGRRRARPHRGVRPHPGPVRPRDRIVPGAAASARRSTRRGGTRGRDRQGRRPRTSTRSASMPR